MASPTKATWPVVRKPFGGGQSLSSRHLTSVSPEMLCAKDRNGSAHVSANLLIRSTCPSFVSGKRRGDVWLKKPSRMGHETTICAVYLPPLPSVLLSGASRTGQCQFHPQKDRGMMDLNNSPLKYTNESFSEAAP